MGGYPGVYATCVVWEAALVYMHPMYTLCIPYGAPYVHPVVYPSSLLRGKPLRKQPPFLPSERETSAQTASLSSRSLGKTGSNEAQRVLLSPVNVVHNEARTIARLWENQV